MSEVSYGLLKAPLCSLEEKLVLNGVYCSCRAYHTCVVCLKYFVTILFCFGVVVLFSFGRRKVFSKWLNQRT